jgi:hypothetical protein
VTPSVPPMCNRWPKGEQFDLGTTGSCMIGRLQSLQGHWERSGRFAAMLNCNPLHEIKKIQVAKISRKIKERY